MANISGRNARREGWLPFASAFRFEMEAILASLRDLTDLAHCCVERP